MVNSIDSKEIIEANLLIKELKAASTRRLLLNDARYIARLAEDDSELGACAKRLVDAQNEFTAKNKELYTNKVNEVTNVVNPLLTRLFKTAIPGAVTLPIEKTGKTASYIITHIEMINVNEKGIIYGVASVTSLDRTTHTTMNFYVEDNQPYFADEDIY